MTIFRFKSLALACVILAGCDEFAPRQNHSICSTPPALDVLTSTAAKTPNEQAELTKTCVHRWSYRLAGAPGSNREIADAVIGACREAVDRELSLYIETSEGGMKMDEISRLRSRLESNYLEIALFRVVQSRAGNCKIP